MPAAASRLPSLAVPQQYAGPPGRIRLDADRAQQFDRAVYDVAVAHRVAAVPENDALADCSH
jgi:hypothetical protein